MDERNEEEATRYRLAGRPGHLIRRLQQIAVGAFLEETRSFDVTPVQYAALFAICVRPGLDLTRLVHLVALDRSTIGRVVDRLEEKGLVRRSSGAADRRQKLICATRAGKALVKAIDGAVERAQARILAPLPTPRRAEFMAMLTILVASNNELSRAPAGDVGSVPATAGRKRAAGR